MNEKSEEEPTLQELLVMTATSMKSAFPSYNQLTIGDITLGLILVAHQHSLSNLYHTLNYNPKLLEDYQRDDNTLYALKEFNPEHIPLPLLEKCASLLKYADLVYYPIKSWEELEYDDPQQEWYTPEEELKQKRPCSHVNHLLYMYKEARQFHQAFFCKLDLHLNALVISVRGTKTMSDVFTNFSCDPTSLTAHKYYYSQNNLAEKNSSTAEDMVEGIVHGGFVKSANRILNQIEPIVKHLFLNRSISSSSINISQPKAPPNETSTVYIHPHLLNEINTHKSRIDKIVICGHSMGGGIGSLLAIELREYFIEKQKQDIELHSPQIECVTFGSSALYDYKLSKWCQQFCHSFVLGGDLVPRFSVGQSEVLRKEVSETNWKDRLDSILNTYSRVGYITKKCDEMLVHWGLPGIVTTLSPPTGEDQPVSEKDEELVCLYPPGNCYLFVRVNDEEDEVQDYQKMISNAIDKQFGITRPSNNLQQNSFNGPGGNSSLLQMIIQEDEQANQLSAVETAKSYFSAGFASLLKSAASSIIATVIEEAPIPQEVKEINMIQVASNVQSWLNSDTKIPKKVVSDHKFLIRHVDAKNFDRIILSSFMIDDHRLERMFGAFDCVIRMETGMEQKNHHQMRMDEAHSRELIYVSANSQSYSSLSE